MFWPEDEGAGQSILPRRSLFISKLFLYTCQFAGDGAICREQPKGRKVTLEGPKSDIGRAEKSHKGQNIILECYIVKQLLEQPPYQTWPTRLARLRKETMTLSQSSNDESEFVV